LESGDNNLAGAVMEPHSLSTLPTELICAILSSVASADDLLSVILTSRRIYDSFKTKRESILSAVAYHSLNAHILADALITVRYLRKRSELSVFTTRRYPTSLDQTILKDRNESPASLQLPLMELVLFFQYQRVVEHFVKDYASRHLMKYGGPPLTTTELYRLRRAFYRYDTFQTTNLLTMYMRESERDMVVWPTLLTEYATSPWEVEEVLCVHQFFIEQLEEVLDQVEAEYIESVVASTQATAGLGGDPDETRWHSEGVAKSSIDHPSHFYETDIEHDEDARSVFWASEKQDQILTAEYLSTFGLPFLCRLFHLTDKRARRAIIVENFVGHACVLDESLLSSVNPFNQEKQGLEEGKAIDFEGDAPEKRNLGWLWANQYLPTPYYASPCDYDFRSWGYVFWDLPRLEYLNVINEPCPRVNRNRSPQKRDRGREKSVEERLREMDIIEERTDFQFY
jgi:hypothetical protein